MSVDIEQVTAHEAKVLTERIRVAIEDVKELVVQAYLSRAWTALGYESWDAYCAAEFASSHMFQLPREDRPVTVRSLRNAGLSLRAIAAATNQSHPQVIRDLRSTGTSEPENVPVGTVGDNGSRSGIGIDGKTRVYAPRRPQSSPPPFNPDSRPTDEPAPKPRPAPVMLTLRTHAGEEVPYPKPQAKATFNQTDGDGISWASWSWNPVTGCLHGCDYCYARSIANRWTDAYPAGFTPVFHHDPEHGYTRLDAPANTTIPAAHRDEPEPCRPDGCPWRRVFVCSMADLYGRWVPDEWISQIHASMLASPQWEYLLLTKFPARYVGLELPPKAWVGTSVDEQKRVRIAENAFREIDGVAVKWLSLEPLREPLKFTDLSMFDWVVIGAQTETRQPDGTVPAFAPPFEWVARIVIQALDAGCKIHLKPNLRSQPGMEWLNQYPVPSEGSA